jgi:hypothetical protein
MSTTIKLKPELALPEGVPFLELIELRHGPIPLLGRFFLLAEQAARERGVHLRLHRDMASLAEQYPGVDPDRGLPVHPIFDPAHHDLSPANSFWIAGHDETGRLVATQAAHFFDMTGSTAERELTSMRLWYADPEKHLATGTRCLVDCPPAERITGRVVYSGCAVYHPKVRGRGLSRILPRMSRALAYSQWNSEYTISMVRPVLLEKNVEKSYGYTMHSPSIKVRGLALGDADYELVWMPRDEMLEDLGRYVSEGIANEVRNTEATETNLAPPRRQGSSSLS